MLDNAALPTGGRERCGKRAITFVVRRCESRTTLGATSLGESLRASRLMIALGVILLGFCAALPFRQPPAVRPRLARSEPRVELPLRKPDVPLGLAQVEPSPASDLFERGELAETPARHSVATETAAQALASVAPPPAMPIAFQPIAEDMRPTSWKPTIPSTQPPERKLRPYRLRDGDTLERLAERYLTDKARAEEIFAINRHVLTRPDLLPVGVEILLPPRKAASAN
jgi:phage tail protein X